MARPLVTTQRYGRGRVLVFAGEAAWRWRMLLPSTDTAYPTFWRQATRWLASQTPEPVTVRTRAHAPTGSRCWSMSGRELQAGAGRRGPAPGPRRRRSGPAPAGASRSRFGRRLPRRGEDAPGRDACGRRSGRARCPDRARHRLEPAGPDPEEFSDPRRNDAQLARLAQRFGGRLVQAEEVARAVDEIAARRAGVAALVEREGWHSPWVLAPLLALMVGEWTLRRRWGLR